MRFDPGAKRLLCVSSTGAIVSLDPAGRKDMPSTLPSTQPGPPEAASQATGLVALSSVSFSADARLVAAGAPAVVRVTDVSTGREIASIKSLVRNFPRAVAMSAYGDVLACVTENAVSLVEVDSGQEIAKAAMSLAYSEPVTLAFSSDGALLAAGVGDGSVTIFQAATGKELLRLDGHRGQVNCLCFSRDGRSLVSGSADGTALLWDLQDLPDRGAPGAKKLDERELKSLWEDLAGKDVAKAHAATWAMAAGADEAAAFLRDRLKPAPQADADRVKKLIEELDSAKFAVRQNAFDELAKLGPLAEDHLRKALQEAGNEELKERLKTLLKALVSPAMRDTELLRTGRAIAALERIGTPAAVKFLEALAAGAESARSTQQAKAALGRLAARAQTAN